jgi:hypothetical protein
MRKIRKSQEVDYQIKQKTKTGEIDLAQINFISLRDNSIKCRSLISKLNLFTNCMTSAPNWYCKIMNF